MIRVCVEIDETEYCQKPQFNIIPKWGPVREQPEQPSSSVTKISHKRLRKGNILMATQMTATQQATASFTVTDKKGNPAKIDGVPEWATDNSDILTITPSPDGLTCEVVAKGTLGTCNLQATMDADLGAGVKPLIATVEIEITPGEATVVTLEITPPTEQP